MKKFFVTLACLLCMSFAYTYANISQQTIVDTIVEKIEAKIEFNETKREKYIQALDRIANKTEKTEKKEILQNIQKALEENRMVEMGMVDDRSIKKNNKNIVQCRENECHNLDTLDGTKIEKTEYNSIKLFPEKKFLKSDTTAYLIGDMPPALFIKKLPVTDIETFEAIGENYRKDKNEVFRRDIVLTGADKETFIKLSGNYGKDKNNIRSYADIITGVDFQSFRVLGNAISIDKEGLYIGAYKKEQQRKDTKNVSIFLETMEELYLKDGNSIYVSFMNNIGPTIEQIPETDGNTFEIMSEGYTVYAKDKKNVFTLNTRSGKVIKTILSSKSPATFIHLTGNYYTDVDTIYFENGTEEIIIGPNTPELKVIDYNTIEKKDGTFVDGKKKE